ncbi:MAG: DUF4158 domain-containing protein [Mesorhizobium sp.]|nr:MAG: DUF4158 domain-containing protein [Mesorhizobium sp.]
MRVSRRRLISPKEVTTLLGIATDEDRIVLSVTLPWNPADRLECELRRRPQNKLGFAIQLCIIRHTGRLLGPDEQPPTSIINYLADQLGVDVRLMRLRQRSERLS